MKKFSKGGDKVFSNLNFLTALVPRSSSTCQRDLVPKDKFSKGGVKVFSNLNFLTTLVPRSSSTCLRDLVPTDKFSKGGDKVNINLNFWTLTGLSPDNFIKTLVPEKVCRSA